MASDRRMEAYYFSFEPTGVDAIDKILSAVAWAGKAYHHTELWSEETNPRDDHTGETPVAWIANAAREAATALDAERARAEAWEEIVEPIREMVGKHIGDTPLAITACVALLRARAEAAERERDDWRRRAEAYHAAMRTPGDMLPEARADDRAPLLAENAGFRGLLERVRPMATALAEALAGPELKGGAMTLLPYFPDHFSQPEPCVKCGDPTTGAVLGATWQPACPVCAEEIRRVRPTPSAPTR